MRRASIPFSIERPFTKIPFCTVRVELRIHTLIIQPSSERNRTKQVCQLIGTRPRFADLPLKAMRFHHPSSLNSQGVIPLHAFLSSLHFYLYTSFTAHSADKDNLYTFGLTGQAVSL
jgi:hypothetical protein